MIQLMHYILIFILANSADPDEMAHYAFSLFAGIQNEKG